MNVAHSRPQACTLTDNCEEDDASTILDIDFLVPKTKIDEPNENSNEQILEHCAFEMQWFSERDTNIQIRVGELYETAYFNSTSTSKNPEIHV